MAWKSSFRQNYRTTFSPTVPPSAAKISRVVEAPGGESGKSKGGGKQWQTTPKLWSLPEPAQGLNTYNSNNNNNFKILLLTS